MGVSTVTSKGQVTVPKAVREHLRLAAGDRVDFVIVEDGRVELRLLRRSVQDLRGFLHREGQTPVALNHLDESLMDHLAAEDDRIRRGE